MQIDVTQRFKTLQGEEIKTGEAFLDLRSVIENALLGAYDDEPKLSGEEKMKRWKLAQTVHAEDRPNLTSEEIVTIKNLVAKGYATMISAQAWSMLEGEAAKAS